MSTTLEKRIAKRITQNGGRTYYVGGYVRDFLRGKRNDDIDIEVYGIEAGMLKSILSEFGTVNTIGKDFGIYQIKGYNIDIALPRTETNTGRGHRDFEVFTDPYLNTETATKRRDFTINAMMMDVLTEEILDYHNGQDDLKNGIIRHTDSKAFAEDPLRVFRAARFAAKFGYKIADETIELCKSINTDALPKERVYEETNKALLTDHPSMYFRYLKEMGQLTPWFEELYNTIGIEQRRDYHPEGDVFEHTMQTVDNCVLYRDKVANPLYLMYAGLCHDLGKVAPDTHIHAEAGVPLAEQMLKRVANEKRLIRNVTEMVGMHMRPLILYANKASDKKYRELFHKSCDPIELIYLTVSDRTARYDGTNEKALEEKKQDYLPILLYQYEQYKEFKRTTPRPTGEDLMRIGIAQGKGMSEVMDFATKLWLAGNDQHSILRQIEVLYV